MRLPEADHALAAHGFTLGHTPQSYEWATVGGCVATRSAGQSSTGHGRIGENVVALRCATPVGELATLAVPGDRRRAVAEAARDRLGGRAGRDHERRRCACCPLPRGAALRGLVRALFAEGCDALRALVQAGIAPDVARLSDEAETGMGSALARRRRPGRRARCCAPAATRAAAC